MAKTTTPQQHDLLHRYWPRDCCLCNHEVTIFDLKQRIDELERALYQAREEIRALVGKVGGR